MKYILLRVLPPQTCKQVNGSGFYDLNWVKRRVFGRITPCYELSSWVFKQKRVVRERCRVPSRPNSVEVGSASGVFRSPYTSIKAKVISFCASVFTLFL